MNILIISPNEDFNSIQLAKHYLYKKYPYAHFIDCLYTYDDQIIIMPEVNNRDLADLGYSIMELGDADLVYFTKGWQNYKNCYLVKIIAEDFDIPCKFEEEHYDSNNG